MNPTKFFRIKNWNKHQHFKDRTPPWIKLYREILDDPDWHELDGDTAKVLIGLWLIASEDETHQGTLPSPRKLAFRLRIKEQQLNQILNKLAHWLIQDDISVISARYQSDAPETERETETETDKKSSKLDDVSLNQQQEESQRKGVRKTKRDVFTGEEISELFEFWKLEHSHPRALLNDGIKKLIKDRGEEGYSMERLRGAIIGIKNSPHHMGKNDRDTKYDSLDVIFRSGTQVDKFADMLSTANSAQHNTADGISQDMFDPYGVYSDALKVAND